MPRIPKAKNGLTAGERAALFLEEQEQKKRRMRADDEARHDTSSEYLSATRIDDRGTEERPIAKKTAAKKPQFAAVRVDFSMSEGEIAPMHGMCNGPVSYNADISSLFSEMGAPFVRFHNTDTEMSRYAIDVSRIFPDADADENDPASYSFDCTDRYIAAAHKLGARIIYRLGESGIAISGSRLAQAPDKWTSVCVHIIRHYNDGWANGFEYGLKYFELLNIGSDKNVESRDELFALYGRAARGIRLYDDGLRLGGMGFHGYQDLARDYVRACKKNKLPLDFLTFDAFLSDPSEINKICEKYLTLLHDLDLGDTELIVGAWNYIDKEALGSLEAQTVIANRDGSASAQCKKLFESQSGVRGAAFAAAMMLNLNRLGTVAAACYYDAQPSVSPWCGICDRFGNPEKTFHAFRAYGELYRAGEQVACVCEQPERTLPSGIYASAARTAREQYVMIASFDGCGMIDLHLEGIADNIYSAEIYMIDGVKDLTLCDTVPLSGPRKRILLNISAYGVVLVKLY